MSPALMPGGGHGFRRMNALLERQESREMHGAETHDILAGALSALSHETNKDSRTPHDSGLCLCSLSNKAALIMEHPDLVAVLYPYQQSSDAIAAITAPENASLHIPAMHQAEQPSLSLRSRDATPEPEENNYESFSYRNKDALRNGTTVFYDGKGGEKRRNFTWILGDPTANQFKQIVFRNELTASTELFFGGLGLQSRTPTAPVSGAQTPPQDPILIKRGFLGAGGFGTVTHRWDVSTGLECACKKPHGPLDPLVQEYWKKEIKIMGQIKHENIVKFHPEIKVGFPLKYLHEQNPPIAHRDLKLENVLVRERCPLHTQLANFGLVKEGSLRTGKIGTACRKRMSEEYLGVKKIIDRANQYKNEGLMEFLTIHMLVLKPEDRSSADVCLKAVEHLSAPSRDGSVTPTQASLARKAPLTSENAVSDLSPSELNAYIAANAPLEESRKRPAQERSSSGTPRQTKRVARTDGSDSPGRHTQYNSVFPPFPPGWQRDSKYVGSDVAAMNSDSDAPSTITNAAGNRSIPSNVDDHLDDPVRASERALSNSEEELLRLVQADFQ
ncbi:serine/threonine protein kinase [Blastomyces dermatitidis ATCC 18188]|uniref:Serine/threonine protein kinase n=1 Tax=Ajellomyces dermatitidis (strain ATCC 18188 / CBS 674.68) TaxID=653446 RepID=F2TE13_AJEDA|nr:serine/threonine protein kinase [Blastomyces dermatitidis ATCC 18188]